MNERDQELWLSRRRAAPYVTDMTGNVFALTGLPEEVVATLLAQYSRAKTGVRELLHAMLEDGGAAEPPADPGCDPVASAARRAAEFHEKWVVGYGHSSVAENAVAHLCVERCSILAAKELEDARLASYIEKSTRYVAFSPSSITPAAEAGVPERWAEPFEQAQRQLLADYAEVTEATRMWLRGRYERPEGTTDAAWENMLRTKAFDLCRGLIPAGAPTSLGFTMNARELSYAVRKWSASPLPEVARLAGRVLEHGRRVAPTLLKHADDGFLRPAALDAVRAAIRESGAPLHDWPGFGGTQAQVMRAASPLLPLHQLSDAIATEATGRPLGIEATDAQRAALVRAYCGGRPTLHAQPGRALEHLDFSFAIRTDFGAWRDLQRHRLLTSFGTPPLAFGKGWYTPAELSRARADGLFVRYDNALRRAEERWSALPREAPWAQYCVPLACHVDWFPKGNLRQWFYLCERRTTAQGHPSYRETAAEIADEILDALPCLADVWKVDRATYDFARSK
jgi:thymidylate synthase ThyX